MTRKLIKDEIDALCQVLRGQSGRDVFVGRPDERSSGLYVLPLNVFPNAEARKAPRTSRAGTVEPPLSVRIQVLITAHPAKDLEGLGRAIQILHEHPIIESDVGLVKVIFAPQPLDAMLSILSWAGIDNGTGACYELSFTEKP